MNADYTGIIGAKLNSYDPNLTEEKWGAVESLKGKQNNKDIVLKPNDKTGGCSVLDCDAYTSSMKAKLCETCVNALMCK